MLDEEILTHIVMRTGNYAKQNNEHGFVFGIEDLKKFIGICLLSGYDKLPSQRMYWSLDEDAGVPLVASYMSRQRVLDMKRFLHLADNDLLHSTNNRIFKVRPLMELLNKKFRQHGIFHETLFIDESIIKYFGHHPCKQFIRIKPISFGYKNWMLRSADGYCYTFETYCGKSITPNKGPLGSRVVLSFLETVPTPSDH